MENNIEEYLYKLPDNILKLIYLIRYISCESHCRVYLVGGFVRDLILGVANLDLDITVEGDGVNFATQLGSRLNGKIIRHRRFGTATVTTPDKIKIDVATARKEFYEKPGSLPKVLPGEIRDDLKRRDFTINAIAISLYPDDFAQIVDFFGGREDIHNKKIRVLHNLSFIDDPTRILRAIRFEQRYRFRLERCTLRLLKEAVSLNMLKKVHPHRLRDEIVLIFKEENPVRYIERLNDLLSLSFIDKRLELKKVKVDFLNSVDRSINWFKKNMLLKRKLDTWVMYFTGLIGDLDTRQIRTICKKFAFIRGDTIRILSYKKLSYKLVKKLKKRLTPSRIFRLLEPLSYEVILLMKAVLKNKILHKNIENFLKVFNGTRLHVTGNDLTDIGMPCGPGYKKILNQALYAKLDKKINTKEEELKFVKNLIKK
jgi:tRNA nucleotidyltransferase (CCA-adding enzyme)